MFAAGCLVVVLVSATGTGASLADCYCGQLGPYLSAMVCSNLEWSEIPPNISTSVEAVDFSNNQIEILKSDDFKGMRSLKSLELQCNYIEDLPANIFEDAEQLQMLDLSFNNIGSLPQEVFKHNGHLEKLYLKQNPLSTPTNLRPLLSSHSLSMLDISFCGITELRGSSFASLKNLVHLNIAGNNITSLHISVVRPLSRLKRLEISGNELECKYASVYETMEYLRKNAVVVVPPGKCTAAELDISTKEQVLKSMTSVTFVETSSKLSSISSKDGLKTTETNLILNGQEDDTARNMAPNSSRDGLKGTESNPILIGREVSKPHERTGIPLSDMIETLSLLLAALILMSATITLVYLERRRQQRKLQKRRPPMPLPDRLRRPPMPLPDSLSRPPMPTPLLDRLRRHRGDQRGSEVYEANSGLLHEYTRLVPQDDDHYSEVRCMEDGYLVPRTAPNLFATLALAAPKAVWGPLAHHRLSSGADAAHEVVWSPLEHRRPQSGAERFLAPPVYRQTTMPVPDIVGQLGLRSGDYLRAPSLAVPIHLSK